MTAVGNRTRRIDWEEMTSGQTKYTSDLRFSDLLVARFLRSPHPHAQILELDVEHAEDAPGVVAVLTADDFGKDFRYHHHGGELADRPPLAVGKVRYIGEEVAAVAAETAEQAEAALQLIQVKYRPLRGNFTPAESRKRGASVIHEHREDNVAVRVRREWGDAVAAPVEVQGTYSYGRQSHASMETNRTVARWNHEEARLEVWTSTQVPYFIQKEIAYALGLELHQVSVREVAVGGGFGSKSKISEHELIVAGLAMKTSGRPVAVEYSRDDEFAHTKPRHSFNVDVRIGADHDGRFLTQEAKITVDNGAYNHYGPSVTSLGCSVMASLYPVNAAHIDAELVYTNTLPGGQFRGYGAPQTTFAIECVVDEMADRLDIDPIDFRLRNAHEPGNLTLAGWKIAHTHIRECLTEARSLIDWDARRASSGNGKGVGVAIGIHPSGSHAYEGADRSEARVTVGADSSVTVQFGGADPGTGQRTLLAQAAAEELGLDPSDISVEMMDSDTTPFDMGSWSSRGTSMGVSAVRDTTRAVAEEIKKAASEKAGVDPSEVHLFDGYALAGKDRYSLGDLATLTGGPDGLTITGEFVSDTSLVSPDGVADISQTYSFAAHAVAVEVDETTGKVTVMDVVAVHDSGIALNPTDAEGQVTGGVAMALGAALGEELLYEQGKVVGPAYIDYALPRAADLPPIRVKLLQFPDPRGPYGAKGIGEIALNPTAAAVANAVANAIGVRIRDLPITPDKVISAIAKRDSKPRHWRRPRNLSTVWNALVRWMYPRGLLYLLHRHGTKFARRRQPRPISGVERPETLDRALTLIETQDGAPVGGATDFLVTKQLGLEDRSVVVDLKAVNDVAGIEMKGDGILRIGASSTLAELSASHLVPGVIRDTVEKIASAQIRQTATVAGNLCQQKRCWYYRSGFDCYKSGGPTCPCYAVMGDHRFYHAAMQAHRCQAVTPSDLATTLLAMGSGVIVEGPNGSRRIRMEDFYEGPGEPALGSGELVSAVEVAPQSGRVSVYEKLNRWHGDFAIISVAASALMHEGRFHQPRVVLGAMAPTPIRLKAVEREIEGMLPSDPAVSHASAAWLDQVDPLPGNEWKVIAAQGLISRALVRLGQIESL